jgi:hypothetical protein
MDRMTSHISHVAFISASDALVDGTALVSERIGVDGMDETDGLGVGIPCCVKVWQELAWKIDGLYIGSLIENCIYGVRARHALITRPYVAI